MKKPDATDPTLFPMTQSPFINEKGYLFIDGIPSLTPLTKFRSIDLVAEIHAALLKLRASLGHDSSHWQVRAIYDFLGLLELSENGRYSIVSQPDEQNRESPSPDYLLRNESSGDELTVEVTQMFAHPSRVKQMQFEINILGRICSNLTGRVSGTFVLILHQRPNISKATLDSVCRKISEAIVAQHKNLTINEFCLLPYRFALVKVSEEGENLAYATAIADQNWGESDATIIRDRASCDRHLRMLLSEAEVKFASYSRGESVVLLSVDNELPMDVSESAISLRPQYTTIDRLYMGPALESEFRRIW